MYNTAETAAGILGQPIREALLETARALIDSYSPYRWEETTVSEVYSGKDCGLGSLWLKKPIIGIDSFTIDFEDGLGPVAQIEGREEDYQVRRQSGEVVIFAGIPGGFDNIAVTYKYGWTASHKSFRAVLLAEAQIAFYIGKNPGMLKTLQVGGAGGFTLTFDKGIADYLKLVPRPVRASFP